MRNKYIENKMFTIYYMLENKFVIYILNIHLNNKIYLKYAFLRYLNVCISKKKKEYFKCIFKGSQMKTDQMPKSVIKNVSPQK